MTGPIVSRDLIAQQAAVAAATAFRTDTPQPNPYPVGSEAHIEFHKRYCMSLLRQGIDADAETSA
jgi:hypothetical protein